MFTDYTRLQEKKVVAFKEKVKAMTGRNQGRNVRAVIQELNPVLRGFANDFRIANCKRQ